MLESITSLIHPYGPERGFWQRTKAYFEESFGYTPTLDEWEKILRDALESKVAVFGENGAPLSVFADLVARRITWLKRARERGMSAGKAEDELVKRIDYEHARDAQRDVDTITRRNSEAAARSRQRPIRANSQQESPW